MGVRPSNAVRCNIKVKSLWPQSAPIKKDCHCVQVNRARPSLVGLAQREGQHSQALALLVCTLTLSRMKNWYLFLIHIWGFLPFGEETGCSTGRTFYLLFFFSGIVRVRNQSTCLSYVLSCFLISGSPLPLLLFFFSGGLGV
jgi:hypothetical protein